MKNYFQQFIDQNKPLFTSEKNRYILVTDRERTTAIIPAVVAAAAIAKKFDLVPILLSPSNNQDHINLFKSFGIKKIISTFSLRGTNLNFNYLKAFYYLLDIFFIYFFKKNFFEYLINSYSLKKIKIGDLIYDSYVRYDLRFKNPKLDFFLLKILYTTIVRILNIIDIIKNHDVKFAVVSTSTYANDDALILRASLESRIKVIEPKLFYGLWTWNKNKIIFGKYNLFNQNKTYDLIKRHDIEKINSFIKKKFQGNIETKYTAKKDIIISNKVKKIYNKKQFFKKLKIKKKYKKIILIAPHLFSDAPHGNGIKFLFRDYYDQLVKTLEYISLKNMQNCLWLVRPHPSSKFFGEIGIVEEVLSKLNNHKLNIKLCSVDSVRTSDLVNFCDHVITGKGNIGLEFAVKGKYSVIAGSSPYSGLNISMEPKTQKEYFKILDNISNLKKLTKNQILKAKKVMYYLDKVDNLDLKVKKSFLAKNPNNFFSKELIRDIKRVGIENDVFYQSILKNFKFD